MNSAEGHNGRIDFLGTIGEHSRDMRPEMDATLSITKVSSAYGIYGVSLGTGIWVVKTRVSDELSNRLDIKFDLL
jgi:hypothetical protein